MSDHSKSDKPIFAKKGKFRPKELFQSGWFVLATYTVVIVFFLILGRITYYGAPEVFTSEFPFIKTEFFTERPQILVVFEDENLKHHRMSMEEFREYKEKFPNTVILAEETHNYSAGGILTPLIGTILIVSICIFCAMVVGVSAAIYLSEYSNRGRFITTIRLAIINLAGVPSIVFGTVWLGLFLLRFSSCDHRSSCGPDFIRVFSGRRMENLLRRMG